MAYLGKTQPTFVPDFPGLVKWLAKCKVTGVPAAPIFNSLW